jgi:hypothetical protein
MMKVLIQRSLQFDSGREVVGVAGSRFAYPETTVRGFAAVDPMGSVDNRNLVVAAAAAAAVAEAPAAEHILETLVVEMDCRSLTSRLAVRSILHTTFAGSEEGRVGVAAEELV